MSTCSHPRPLSRRRMVVIIGALLTVTTWAIGQLLRDRTWWSAFAFYLPTALVFVVQLVAAALAGVARRRRLSAALLILAAVPAASWLAVEQRFLAAHSQSNATAEFRVVHWNVGGRLRSSGAIDVLVDEHADLYLLSESGPSSGVTAFASALGRDYSALEFSNLAIVSNRPVRLGDVLLARRRTLVRLAEWESAAGMLRLMIVDLPSELSIARDPLLQAINELIVRHEPDLILGDFNAPRRSRALANLPAGYRHAFDTVGTGCGDTWPAVAPLLAIDQCAIGPQIQPVRYRLRSTWSSDHRVQQFDGALWRRTSL